MINLKGRNKAEVLAKLYNASRPQGLGFLHADGKDMTVEEAKVLLDRGQTYFDYLKGRVMKVDLQGDELDPSLYDRDNGKGAAENALNKGLTVKELKAIEHDCNVEMFGDDAEYLEITGLADDIGSK